MSFLGLLPDRKQQQADSLSATIKMTREGLMDLPPEDAAAIVNEWLLSADITHSAARQIAHTASNIEWSLKDA